MPLELPKDSAIRAPLKPGGLAAGVGSPSFSSDGKTIASRNSREVMVFEVKSGRQLSSFEPKGGGRITYSPDGKMLAAPIPAGQWGLLDPANGKMLRALDPIDLKGQSSFDEGFVAFSPDGKRLAVSHRTGSVVVWDVASGKQIRVLPPYIMPAWHRGPTIPGGTETNCPALPAAIGALAFSPDGGTLYTSGYVLRAWNLDITTVPRHFDLAETMSCKQMALSSDGKTLAAADWAETRIEEPHSIFLIDTASGRRKAEIITSTKEIQGLAFRPGGRELVTLEGERVIRLWDVATAKQIAACRFDQHFTLYRLAISPDGSQIAASGEGSAAIFGVIGMVETDGTKLSPWKPAP